MIKRVSSWGRLSAYEHNVVNLDDPSKVKEIIAQGPLPGLAYGMGRSYGDSCLNPEGTLWNTCKLDHLIAFDERTGRLVCEGGVLLRDIQRLIISRGWILPVTPGTQLVTVGGAIANDVHGKNHHIMGSFGNHVCNLTLIRTDGEIINCGPNENTDWFTATIGGLGLTGVILQAEIQLQTVSGPWLDSETIPYNNLNDFFQLADNSEAAWDHTASWIDCTSSNRTRGLFMRATSAKIEQKIEPKNHKLSVPFTPYVSLINKLSLRPLNFIYFNLKKLQKKRTLTHYESFLYPLDNLLEWNRIYGPKGFFQHQSVVPREVGEYATRVMLKEISRSGEGSFLGVLKTFGSIQPVGMMSFPRPGVTLALDFPNHDDRTRKLLNRLDDIVHEAGGRLYLAKDARMSRKLFEAGYPRLSEFIKYRDAGISSSLSRRLMDHKK